MRVVFLVFLSILVPSGIHAEDSAVGPSDEKARKTYGQALEHVKEHEIPLAFDSFRKADKRDGGHCLDCKRKIVKYGIDLHEWKAATEAAT